MNIQEVRDLRRQLDEEYKKDIEAISRVEALLARSTQQATPADTEIEKPAADAPSEESLIKNDIPVVQPAARKFNFVDEEKPAAVSTNGNSGSYENAVNINGNKFGRVRDAGVKGVAKQAVPFLPQEFQRKDLITTMAAHFPEWSDKLTKDAINGALARLLEDGLVEVKEKARGKFPATYAKKATSWFLKVFELGFLFPKGLPNGRKKLQCLRIGVA